MKQIKTITLSSSAQTPDIITQLAQAALEEKQRLHEELQQETYIPNKQRAVLDIYVPLKAVSCKLCQRPAPEGHTYCYSCIWKTRWAPHILNDPENERRRKRSHLTNLLSIAWDVPEGIFKGSGKDAYITHLNDCTCKDFGLGHKKRPCKHIYRLAAELGLYAPERFAQDEDDYIMHIHEKGFDVDEYFKQLRGVDGDETDNS